MKIATFNVNGINGRLPVLLRWLDEAAPVGIGRSRNHSWAAMAERANRWCIAEVVHHAFCRDDPVAVPCRGGGDTHGVVHVHAHTLQRPFEDRCVGVDAACGAQDPVAEVTVGGHAHHVVDCDPRRFRSAEQ